MKKKNVLFVLVAFLLVLCLTACSGESATSLKDQLVGSWYKNGRLTTQRDGGKGPLFTLYDDGTCVFASEYGTGTWSVVNENELKLTTFYGESETMTIESVENGCLTLEDGTVYWNAPKDDGNSAADGTENYSETDTLEGEDFSVTLVSASSFSEGIAWVRYLDRDGDEQIGWLYADGSIDQPFPTDLITRCGSNFSGGYSYLNHDDGSFTIIDSSGKVYTQNSEDSVSYQILCGGDGVYLVEQSIRNMT